MRVAAGKYRIAPGAPSGHADGMTNDSTKPTPVPRPAPGAPRRLVRPLEGRIIAGVAAGVARHLNVDPWLVRIVTIVLIAFGGIGLLLYGAGWLLIPEEGTERAVAESWLAGLRGSTAWIGVALIAVAGIWIAASTDVVSAGLAWAIALLVLGVLLYRGRLPGGEETKPDGVPASADRAPGPGEAGDTSVPAAAWAGGEPAAPAVPASALPAPVVGPAPRPRSFLGRLTLGTMFITLGVMAALDATGATRPALRHYLVASVLVIGLGLLIGAVAGRSRGMVVLGLLLLPALFASVAVTAPFTGGFDDATYRPRQLEEIHSPYRLTAGQMTLDLGALDLEAGQVLEVVASVGAGRLYVVVPEAAGLDVTGHVGFGEVTLPAAAGGGIDVDRRVQHQGDGTLVLDLDVGFGQVEVVRSVPERG
jgi:phage shock protein PspC (stress-responsive transcriptional regulator)